MHATLEISSRNQRFCKLVPKNKKETKVPHLQVSLNDEMCPPPSSSSPSPNHPKSQFTKRKSSAWKLPRGGLL